MKAKKITPKTVLNGYDPEDALPVFSKNYNDLLDDLLEIQQNGVPGGGTTISGLTQDVIPKSNPTGDNIENGTWKFVGNALIPVTDGSDFGQIGGTINTKGSITATTQSANDNSTKIATTAYVDSKKIDKNQSFTSQTSVTINHGYGVYPKVQVIDSNGYLIQPLNIRHTSVNSFTVTFSNSTTGNIIY